jgi:hypothetical protein
MDQEERPGEPGGRYTVTVNGSEVVYDGQRLLPYPYTSPLHELGFHNLPGRNWPSSPQDILNSPQRHLNAERTHIAMHTALMADPVTVLDKGSGLKRQQWTNEPGLVIDASLRPGVSPVQYIDPPSLGESVWRHAAQAAGDLEELGMLQIASGQLAPDASGEAYKEKRFDADRFLGPALRAQVEELARMAKTWLAHFPILYDRQELIRVAGEDDAQVTIAVAPELFDLESADVYPDAESMLPESRAERQGRARAWYDGGLLGQPGTFEALRRYWDIARFPHHARAAQIGGADAETARRENAHMLEGNPESDVPTFPWYDDKIHVYEHEQQMKAWGFRDLPEEVKNAFVMHWQRHKQNIFQAEQAAMMAAAEAAASAPGGGGGGGGGGKTPPARTQVTPSGPAAGAMSE